MSTLYLIISLPHIQVFPVTLAAWFGIVALFVGPRSLLFKRTVLWALDSFVGNLIKVVFPGNWNSSHVFVLAASYFCWVICFHINPRSLCSYAPLSPFCLSIYHRVLKVSLRNLCFVYLVIYGRGHVTQHIWERVQYVIKTKQLSRGSETNIELSKSRWYLILLFLSHFFKIFSNFPK